MIPNDGKEKKHITLVRSVCTFCFLWDHHRPCHCRDAFLTASLDRRDRQRNRLDEAPVVLYLLLPDVVVVNITTFLRGLVCSPVIGPLTSMSPGTART